VLYHEVNVLKQDYEAKIQGLMAEKHIQIGTIETLKEQLKEQRDDFLAAIKEGKIINATNYVEGNMSGGNMAGHDMVISTEAELRKI
jgi:primosomal protein N''